MRIVSNFLFVSFLVLLFASCRSQREKVVYLQDIQTFNREIIAKPYDVKIEKDDVLNILVSSRDPELSTPYNQVLTTRTGPQRLWNELERRLPGRFERVHQLSHFRPDLCRGPYSYRTGEGDSEEDYFQRIYQGSYGNGAASKFQSIRLGRGESSGFDVGKRRANNSFGSDRNGRRPDNLWPPRSGFCD